MGPLCHTLLNLLCRDQGTWQRKGWKELKSLEEGEERCGRFLLDLIGGLESQPHSSCGFPAEDQDGQHSIVGGGGDHEAPPSAEELLAVLAWGGEFFFPQGCGYW